VKDALLHGVYPTPLGAWRVARRRAHRRSSRDRAGRRRVTTAIWRSSGGRHDRRSVRAAALGKVTYAGNDLDAWEGESLKFMPDWMVYDFKHMYVHFQKEGLLASMESTARVTKLLGRAPRSFEAFAAEATGAS
jgi:hypothetical protein